ncbi:hypothetical protein FJQ98_16650 [Lysinibacillus agricola]|uniref:Uncharacterized protein n=1 Tax=Lysinibacillus agricola TaxID=2590012 RepID=A0ABX7ALU5_9BACI|nr:MULTISPECIES: hypothetical protein [Lysinibacillus]QQP10875.1 hypothetical protein FJQ98_16650 [Lysinibacillus agricola]
MNKITCNCCGKEKKPEDFYSSPSQFMKHTGKVGVCKICIWNYVEPTEKDNYNIEIVKDALRMIDKPFIQDLWESAISEAESRNTKSNYFKLYMKNIAMPQNISLSWKDSDFAFVISDNTINVESSEVDIKNDFNDKDNKSYNKKWMGEYSPSEIEYLEGYLNGLHKDFKIVTENHKDYAKKIAKASLHMDNCFRDVLEGVSGADKRYKDAKDVFDTLSKSAQFSESQRGQNEVGLGCFGRVFELVETKTFIPEHIPTEQDDIDKMLNDFGHILKSL